MGSFSLRGLFCYVFLFLGVFFAVWGPFCYFILFWAPFPHGGSFWGVPPPPLIKFLLALMGSIYIIVYIQILIKTHYIIILISIFYFSIYYVIIFHVIIYSGACLGGGKGPVPPPPLEIEKQKKVIKGNFNYAISPIFCYYFSRKYYFLCYFLSCPPPPLEKVKGKKNCFSDFRPPPLLTNSWTRHCILYINSFFVM